MQGPLLLPRRHGEATAMSWGWQPVKSLQIRLLKGIMEVVLLQR